MSLYIQRIKPSTLSCFQFPERFNYVKKTRLSLYERCLTCGEKLASGNAYRILQSKKGSLIEQTVAPNGDFTTRVWDKNDVNYKTIIRNKNGFTRLIDTWNFFLHKGRFTLLTTPPVRNEKPYFEFCAVEKRAHDWLEKSGFERTYQEGKVVSDRVLLSENIVFSAKEIN